MKLIKEGPNIRFCDFGDKVYVVAIAAIRALIPLNSK